MRRLRCSDIASFLLQNGEKLDSVIIYDRDFDYDYFGFKVRAASYCMQLVWSCVLTGTTTLQRRTESRCSVSMSQRLTGFCCF